MGDVKRVEGQLRDDILAELEAILASRQFVSAAQLSSFLRYIVHRTIDGEQDQLKAYAIGVDALGRSADFDPQNSAAVRVSAGRLRQLLAVYYAENPQRNSPVTISLSPGTYVPAFIQSDHTLSGPTSLSPALYEPSIEVLPEQFGDESHRPATNALVIIAIVVLGLAAAYFYSDLIGQSADKDNKSDDHSQLPRISIGLHIPDKPYPDWFKLGEFRDAIALVVARFDDYRFGGVYTIETTEENPDHQADYVIKVSAYRRDDNINFFGSLIRQRDNTVLWSSNRVFGPPSRLSDRSIPAVLGPLFSSLASPYGVIHADIAKQGEWRGTLGCIVSGYQYFHFKSDERHYKARECAEILINSGSQSPTLSAMLTFLYLDEYRESRNPRDRNPIEAAAQMAQHAINLGPQSARAHQALFAAYKVQRLVDEARYNAEKALRLNPFDSDIVGDYAAWLLSNGFVKEGKAMLIRATLLMEGTPAWFDFYTFLASELAGDEVTANASTLLMDKRRSPLLAIAVAIGASRRGDIESARAAIANLKETAPEALNDPVGYFVMRGFSDDIASRLAESLKTARSKALAKPLQSGPDLTDP